MFIFFGKGFYKGFQLKFENGYILSVQFGPYNYCDNKEGGDESPNAEIAVIKPDGDFLPLPLGIIERNGGDDVTGYVSPADMLKVAVWVEALPQP